MTDNTFAEEWRPIPGFPGYEASNLGRVRSLKRGIRVLREGYLRGYAQVSISINGVHMSPRVHRLVLLAFQGEPDDPSLHGCHADNDPGNNHIDNLRWDTPAGNAADTRRDGRHRCSKKTRCTNGHEFTVENTFIDTNGHRRCLACRRAYDRRRRPASRWPGTHCPQGHEYNTENTYVNPKGRKVCRICQRAAIQRYKQRQRSKPRHNQETPTS